MLVRGGRELVFVSQLRDLDSVAEAALTEGTPQLPWAAPGARLHWPRDGHLAYLVGRMGVVRSVDVWPVLYGSHSAGKIGFARLQRLGLLRGFERTNLAAHAWYGLAPQAVTWVAQAMGCAERELRVVHGIARMNLAMVRDRNRLWVSVVLACRSQSGVRVALVRPEWELRRSRPTGTRVVPDFQVVLEVIGVSISHELVWFVELDAGTERLSVLEAKARSYLEAAVAGPLYGEQRWRVLVVVPTVRRARSVASALSRSERGDKFFVAVQAELEEGRALEPRLWRADELAGDPRAAPRWSLYVGREAGPDEADPRPLSAADRGLDTDSREVLP